MTRKGYKQTEEHKQKISQSHMGITKEINPNLARTEEYKRLKSIQAKEFRSEHPEIAERMNENIRKATQLRREGILQHGNKGKKRSEEAKRATGLKMLGNKRGCGHSPSEKARKEIGLKNSKSMSLLWKDPVYAERQMRLQGRKPNKAELFLNSVLQRTFPNNWMYVGNGKFWIDGKNPDFVNINGRKQFIELLGNYWHRNDDPQCRIALFKKFGFDTLIIWEKELKDEKAIIEKIEVFSNA